MTRPRPRGRTLGAVSALDRWRGADPRLTDGLLAGLLLAVAQVEVWLSAEVAGRRPETAVAAAAMTVALVWRRSHPLAALAGVMLPFSALGVTGELPTAVFVLPVALLAMYSVGAHARGDRAVVALALGLAAVAASATRVEDPTVTDLTAPALMFAGAWAVGRSQLARRLRLGHVEDRAARLEREQAERERAAAAEERRRIARELHDIVAHRVSTMVIQAESGVATADEPGRAQESFAAIAGSGRQALGELRRLLGLLRDEDETAAVAPQPGLARLDELLEQARGAGLPVHARVDGDVRDLPPGIDLAAYRVVQEALTNVLRHARTPAAVEVRREQAALAVVVRNALPAGGPPPHADGAGHGLAGMRERVRVHRGAFSAGPADGDFVVRATLPLDP